MSIILKALYASALPEAAVCSSEKYFPEKATNILELGSGMGRNGSYFVNKGFHVTFVDSSHVANDTLLLGLLERRHYCGYEIIETDISEYFDRYQEQQFDVILATHVISHGTVSEIRNLYIKKILDLLVPDGVFVATLPSTSDVRCPKHEAMYVSVPLTEGPEKGIVHSFFSREGVFQMMNGFEIQELTQQYNNGNVHWVITAVKKNDLCINDDQDTNCSGVI